MRKDGFIHTTCTQQIFWVADKMFITVLGTCQVLSTFPLLLPLLLLLLFARSWAELWGCEYAKPWSLPSSISESSAGDRVDNYRKMKQVGAVRD